MRWEIFSRQTHTIFTPLPDPPTPNAMPIPGGVLLPPKDMCQKNGGTPSQKSCRQLWTPILYLLPCCCKRKLPHCRSVNSGDFAGGDKNMRGTRRGRLSVIAPIAHGPLPRSLPVSIITMIKYHSSRQGCSYTPWHVSVSLPNCEAMWSSTPTTPSTDK